MRRHRTVLLATALLALSGGCSARQPAATIEPSHIVDLSYSYGPSTIYWPTAESFELEEVAHGTTPQGYWYAANNLKMAEHGGTHMDAPIHFAEGKRSADEVPLSSCIGPAVVIDVRRHTSKDRDYRLGVADLLAWESAHGRIPAGAIVIMNSGWGSFWPDKKLYLGTDRPGDVAGLHFPGFGQDAAEWLLRERDIAAIAVDTPSIDYGQSTDFLVHRLINGADKPGFENLANVDRLPASGATLLALPIKIERGSGGPARIVAIVPPSPR